VNREVKTVQISILDQTSFRSL